MSGFERLAALSPVFLPRELQTYEILRDIAVPEGAWLVARINERHLARSVGLRRTWSRYLYQLLGRGLVLGAGGRTCDEIAVRVGWVVPRGGAEYYADRIVNRIWAALEGRARSVGMAVLDLGIDERRSIATEFFVRDADERYERIARAREADRGPGVTAYSVTGADAVVGGDS